MSNKIIEKYKAMPIEDLFGEFSDWFKGVNGVRPRHIAPTDRDSIIAWIIRIFSVWQFSNFPISCYHIIGSILIGCVRIDLLVDGAQLNFNGVSKIKELHKDGSRDRISIREQIVAEGHVVQFFELFAIF